jgi:CheY-like chemotaxis protein
MPKTVIDCGNCGPDHAAIRRLVESHFDAVVIQTHGVEDTLERVRSSEVDLICVNRKLDRDYSDGIEVIKRLRSDRRASQIPVMLVTNYEEHQRAAVEEGAVRGFGKLAIGKPETLEALRPHLGQPASLESSQSDVS